MKTNDLIMNKLSCSTGNFCFCVVDSFTAWREICWKCGQKRSSKECRGIFLTWHEKSAVIWIWRQMGPATCSSTSYYLLWFLSVSLASRLGSISVHCTRRGEEQGGRRTGLTSSITAPTARQPFETQRYKPDPQITFDNLVLSCYVLKRLIRNFWRTWLHLDASHSSHIFSLLLPYFSLDSLCT